VTFSPAAGPSLANVTVFDTTAFDIKPLAISGNLSVTSPVLITLSGAVTVGGNATFAGVGPNLGGSDLTVVGTLTAPSLVATGSETVRVGADWIVAAFTPATSTVEFTGTGTIQAGTAAAFYTLVKSTVGITDYNENLTIIGGLALTGGTLQDPGSHVITMGNQGPSPATVTWTASGGVFSPGAGSVHFDHGDISISGANTFYDFYVDTAALGHPVTISFANGPANKTTVTHNFHVLGTSSDRATLKSGVQVALYAVPPPDDPSLSGFVPPDTWFEQWQISVVAAATINWAIIQLSSAGPAFITPGKDCTDDGYNHNWYFVVPILASWTMDHDGNGRIDRIRVAVKTGTVLNNDFTGFVVKVTGYTVTGYLAVPGAVPPDVFDIVLQEGKTEDTDAAPTWKVLTNPDLIGTIGGALVDHDPNKVYGAAAGARPVISYTLAALGSTKAYVHFSGLVYGDALGNPLPPIFLSAIGTKAVVSILPTEMAGNGAHAAIVTLSGALDATDILSAPETLSALAATVYGKPYPATFNYPSGPSNGDPGDGTYNGNPLIGNYLGSGGRDMFTTAHNVSDFGINFVTPVFALDTQLQRDPSRGGIGLVNVFDGTKTLPPQNTLIEARILEPTLTGAAVTMYWAANPPAPAGYNNNLWMPSVATTLWSLGNPGGDSGHFPGYAAAAGTPAGSNGALRDYTVAASALAGHDGATFQFIFVIDDGTHSLPLVFPVDPADPSKVRPFEYDLHSIIAQRGEVTILNNVINPTAGDTVAVRYVMPQAGAVTVTVFSLSGDIVAILARGNQAAGEHTTAWDGKNRSGAVVARGVYFIRVVGPGFDETRKVLVVK
jgi:hypothetical protein